MYSVWNSVHSWVFICLCRLTAANIELQEEKTTRLEGSCVTIQCKYEAWGEMKKLWFKNAIWDNTSRSFNGTIVYSNTEARPQHPEYSNRVEFFNEIWSSCSLRIFDLKINDSGNYSFRHISLYKPKERYMSKFLNLTVTENPCKVHIRPLNLNKPLKEGDTVSFHCATSAACASHPKWLSSVSSELEEEGENREKLSVLKLILNWKDDRRTLRCHSSENAGDHCLEKSVTLSVQYAPKETTVTQMSNTENVKEGEQVRISCSSKAHPDAFFRWFKRDSPFMSSGEMLTLNNVSPENKGSYYCQAENIYGHENSTDIIIDVMFKPKGVYVVPTPKKLKEGETLTLTCSVESSNPAVYSQSYMWYKDDQRVDQATEKLSVQSVKRSDIGGYQCEASNSVGGTMSAKIEVSVEYGPQNTYIKGRHSIKLGLNLNLECFTEADPPAYNYSWYFKAEHEQQYYMLPYTERHYVIKEVAVINAGMYKCSAENVIGRGQNSSEINISVLYSPRKPILTMKQVVGENELFSITCTVESSPKAKLTLKRSSWSNPEKVSQTIKTVSSNFLNFTTKASVQDAGTYTCVAINSEGQNSSIDQLKVLYAPKNVSASAYPGNELKEGSELKLQCTADCVPEVSAYTWKKSFGTHSVTVGHGQTLTLVLKSSDSNHYFCISSNEIGSAESPAVYIRVKYRPRITIIHNMTSLGVFESIPPVYLICSVQSDPPVTLFEWYNQEKNNVLSTNQNYTVEPQHSGTYYCDASNEVGKSRSEPIEINLNHFFIKRLVHVIISILFILFLIGVIFLLFRFVLSKRLGTNEAAQRSFFFSPTTLSSSGSRNNTRENLVMDGSSEISGFRDIHSSSVDYSYSPANRTAQAERSDNNIHTTYDLLQLPSILKQHHHQEDLTMTSRNYVQFKDNNPNKSCGAVYANISKQKETAKEQKAAKEDYENVAGVCTTKQPFSNIHSDSHSSESEEEVTYSIPLFSATLHHNPQRKRYGSDEEDETEYSQVKI